MKLERCIKSIDIPSLMNDPIMTQIADKAIKRHGGFVHVVIENIRETRSTGEHSQNRHFNGHIQQLANELGWEFEDMKRYIKQIAVAYGYPIKYRNGQAVTDPWGNVVGISEKDATTADCSILIEAAHRIAAEEGIILKEGD